MLDVIRPGAAVVDSGEHIVARFHGPASHVNRRRPGDVFKLRRGGDFAARTAIHDDALFVSWSRQSDDWQARLFARGAARSLAVARRANFHTEQPFDLSGEAR